jgi:hypothetical protein
MPREWKEIRLAGTALRLRSPVDLAAAGREGIDSHVSVFQGKNLEVTVDEGPFCDPLTGYGDRPEHRMTEEPIGGRPARVVSFRLDEAQGHFAGAHFDGEGEGSGPSKLTIAVIGREDLGGDVPLQVVKSVQFDTREGRAHG